MNKFACKIIAKHKTNQARVMKVTTPHGEFLTPTFMPVATRAVVSCMTPVDLQHSQSQIILGGNTYHMLCKPGMDVIEKAGGMHPFMGWHGPMLTDSGGFQVFSLSKDSKICKIDDKGAHFRHPDYGNIVHLTPQTSIAAQKIIGADIIMAFDQCTPEGEDKSIVAAIMQRTHRWLMESKDIHDANPQTPYGNHQALFGIVQGGYHPELRMESAEFVNKLELDGIAIGGESIGFHMDKTVEIIDWVRPVLNEQKVRYTMGVGLNPTDLIDVVTAGIDIFDCVAPTRNARHGALYNGRIVDTGDWVSFEQDDDKGRVLINKTKYAQDQNPIMQDCPCYTCQNFTRSYMHFLFKSKALAYYNFACIHNVSVMQQVCDKMRDKLMRTPVEERCD